MCKHLGKPGKKCNVWSFVISCNFFPNEKVTLLTISSFPVPYVTFACGL